MTDEEKKDRILGVMKELEKALQETGYIMASDMEGKKLIFVDRKTRKGFKVSF